MSSLNSNATSYAPAANVSANGYASHNGLKTETYGNGLIHALTYNNRLQPTDIKLGTSGNPTSVLSLAYNYGTTNNNGNVQSITYNGGGLSYTQTFGYDPLNRLTTSVENGGSSWSQTNGYDRYGNRWIDLGGGSQSLYFTASTNRITGWSYDAAGNLLNDGVHTYTFDAENKIRTVDTVTAYAYDGEGQRVKKLVGENMRFVYGIGGELVAEFDGSTGNLKKEYVYAGGTLITIEPTAVNSNGTQYSTADHLGTPRAITNASGSVVSRHDYMPFGEELFAGTGGRTTGMGYSGSGDNNRKKFTGYERDTETGLDFAQARYYANSGGRFLSADPLFMDLSRLTDPQLLNLYAYCRNNSLRYIDPSGLDVTLNGSSADQADYLKRLQEKTPSFSVATKDNTVKIVDKDGKELSREELKALDKTLKDKGEKEVFKAITDTEKHATINLVRSDVNVDFGRHDGKGTNTIDLDDLDVLDKPNNAGGPTASQAVGHETIEAYASAKGKDDPHAYANNFFAGIDPVGLRAMQGRGSVATMEVQRWQVHGSAKMIETKKQLVPPVTIQQIKSMPANRPLPGHIVDVTKLP